MDPSRLIVVFPDFRGIDSSSNHLPSAIHEVVPSATIIAAINGVDVLPLISPDVTPVFTPPGFNEAVLTGLAHAVGCGPALIARIDNNSHPPRLLPYAFSALAELDLVVLDHTFSPHTLAPGSAEDYHTSYIIPELVRQASSNQLSLSGSHGFMAFKSDALSAILPIATRAFALAKDAAAKDGFPTPLWSADTLLPLIALRLGQKVGVRYHLADSPRSNPLEKSLRQVRDLLYLIHALDEMSSPAR